MTIELRESVFHFPHDGKQEKNISFVILKTFRCKNFVSLLKFFFVLLLLYRPTCPMSVIFVCAYLGRLLIHFNITGDVCVHNSTSYRQTGYTKRRCTRRKCENNEIWWKKNCNTSHPILCCGRPP